MCGKGEGGREEVEGAAITAAAADERAASVARRCKEIVRKAGSATAAWMELNREFPDSPASQKRVEYDAQYYRDLSEGR